MLRRIGAAWVVARSEQMVAGASRAQRVEPRATRSGAADRWIPTTGTRQQTGAGDALLKEYGEVAGNFRSLTDIRFKLPAFLPIAAAATAAVRGARGASGATAVATLGLSLCGCS